MLKTMLQKVCQRYNAGKPRVVVGVPSGITEVEERAVEESVLQAGAKEVYIIEEPMAAAIGANIEVSEPAGSIIVDIGGGTTEVAIISLGGIVVSNSLRIAGDKLDQDIINYVKKELNLAIRRNNSRTNKNKNRLRKTIINRRRARNKRKKFKHRASRSINNKFYTSTRSNAWLNRKNYRFS